MNFKKIIAETFANVPIYQQILGKRTDDIGYEKLVSGSKSKCRLSHNEKNLVKHTWGRIIPSPLSIGYSFYEMVKSVKDFSAEYLPSSYYMPYVFRSLNSESGLKILGHKGLQRILFRNCEQPETVVCRISGILYDENYRTISEEDALDILCACEQDMIYKPATDSSMGRGVKLINPHKIPEDIVRGSNDFIIQKRVIQSEFMSSLNASSLNCIRLTSININGKASVENRVIKIGAKGQIVDNIGAGSGGMMIGVSENGELDKYGYRVDGTRVDIDSYSNLSNVKIPNFKTATNLVIELHKNLNSMKIIGWDIALDQGNRPVLIEANTYWPGITIEQIANGPIFGDRTQEVISYISNKL